MGLWLLRRRNFPQSPPHSFILSHWPCCANRRNKAPMPLLNPQPCSHVVRFQMVLAFKHLCFVQRLPIPTTTQTPPNRCRLNTQPPHPQQLAHPKPQPNTIQQGTGVALLLMAYQITTKVSIHRSIPIDGINGNICDVWGSTVQTYAFAPLSRQSLNGIVGCLTQHQRQRFLRWEIRVCCNPFCQ